MQRSDCSSDGDIGTRGYEESLPSLQAYLDVGRLDAENTLLCLGGEIPDRLHPWYRLLHVPKCGCPGPEAQHRPLHGPGVPPCCDPEGVEVLMLFLICETTVAAEP